MKKSAVCFLGLWLAAGLQAIAQLVAGPMLGYAEMTETLIWIQAERPGVVQLEYWPENEPTQKALLEDRVDMQTEGVHKFVLRQLKPGTRYVYRVGMNSQWLSFDYPLTFKTLDLWQYRTEPPDFRMVTGSCHYTNEEDFDRPGRPYGSGVDVFSAMVAQNPDMMLWLGDNVYLREPDWNTWGGFVHRYTHTRSQPELQRFLATCNHYAIWDDHDFGPNDANGSFIHKEHALNAFKLFWGNPSYGLPGLPSTIGQFRFHDVEFFLLDNRYYRTDYKLETIVHQILGKEQIDWLIQALKYSRASFKVIAVGGQFLNSAAVYENHANYPKERQEILDRLAREELHNVVFLTGDRHHSELSKLDHKGVVIHDFTVSPLTAGFYEHEEENLHRVADTKFIGRNFATIDISGKRNNRVMKLSLYKDDGELLWEHEIPQVVKKKK